MSVEKKTYIIYGYDLSARREEIMTEEICESKLHDEMTYNQQPGKVQIFDDPMCGDHLYVGFIIGEVDDDYSDKCIKVNTDIAGAIKETVDNQLSTWEVKTGSAPFVLMVFNEFT